jgi:outer membrane protein assembly factor BamE (lipoprotein component of BamABCDE complex)
VKKPVALLALCLALAACAPPRAVVAVREGQIRVGTPMAQVLSAAGEPDLVLAARGAETFFYRVKEQAVVITLVGGKVVAFSDAGAFPRSAFEATDRARKPVSTGRIHVGMTEKEVRAALGDPDGITAKEGVETLHWLTGDVVDSVVILDGGKVSGFWDRPVSEYTQNLPTADRDEATTSGRIRVGMTEAEVAKLLGTPDGVEEKGGLRTLRWDTSPVFGDHILYGVGFRNGRVVNLHEFNVTRDEDEKAEAEARREAELAAQREAEAQAAMQSAWSNPLVQAALGAAVQGALGGQPVQQSYSEQTVQSSDERTLTINGTTYRGSGPAFGSRCSLDAPCPDGYKCALITNSSGACVQ